MTDHPPTPILDENALLPCPFCGGTNIDPEGWSTFDRKGPACDDCEGSCETVERWNTRHHLAHVQAPGIADGWALVPIEPTREMLRAGAFAWWNALVPDDEDDHTDASTAWSAMLSARPVAPAAKGLTVRWNGNRAYVGNVRFGRIWTYLDSWFAYDESDTRIGVFPTKPEAMAAVAKAAFTALTQGG